MYVKITEGGSLSAKFMKQMSVIITLGIIQIIILSLFGLYFYQLKHTASLNKSQITTDANSN